MVYFSTSILPFWLLFLQVVVVGVWGRILAPIMTPHGAQIIQDQYIIVLKDENALGIQSADIVHRAWLLDLLADDMESKIIHFFDTFKGYAAKLTATTLDAIRSRDEVDYVERDQKIFVDNRDFLSKNQDYHNDITFFRDNPKPSLHNRVKFSHSNDFKRIKSTFLSALKKSRLATATQYDAPWGLSRISAKSATQLMSNYLYPISAGSDVDVYVIDTGIYIEHEEFGGRARWGITIPKFDFDLDANGHGTHCAGVIAGKTYGVAKNANVIAVKVLRSDGFGTNSDVIKGIEWVTSQHRAGTANGKRSVASMSLGGGKSFALEKALTFAIRYGISFAVAAGNDFSNACAYSPAGSPKAVTVGASDILNGMAYFSNYGPCVDIFAPGVDIISAWIGKEDAYNIISGTSMATPHVAGVMALYLGVRDYDPIELKEIILKYGIGNILSGVPLDTPNNLINTDNLVEGNAEI